MTTDEMAVRIAKNIPLTVVVALFIQTCGAIWWAATISSDVREVAKISAQLRAETYSRAEALIQIQRLDQADAALSQRLAIIEARRIVSDERVR